MEWIVFLLVLLVLVVATPQEKRMTLVRWVIVVTVLGFAVTGAGIYVMEQRKAAEEEIAARAAAESAAHEAERKQRAEHIRLVRPEQDAFDALPKWDILARPINREPPPGLQPTAALPPPPYVKPPPSTPDPRAVAAEIAKKYGVPR